MSPTRVSQRGSRGSSVCPMRHGSILEIPADTVPLLDGAASRSSITRRGIVGPYRKTAVFLMFLMLSMATSAHGALAGTWSLTGSMSTAREGHTATLLSDGRVVVSGGDDNVVGFASEVSNETLGRERLRLIAYGNKPAAV